jgi:pentatricopeptide repeat protein
MTVPLSAAGRPPPLEAYGALLAGYARRKQTEAALSALQDFVQRGGTPDSIMFDTVVNLCVRTGEFRRAMQVASIPPLHS